MRITSLSLEETRITEKPQNCLTTGISKCIRIEDEETGLIIISTKGRSQLDNKNIALRALNCYKSKCPDFI